MNLDIPKITTTIRKINISAPKKVDFSNIQKVDMSKICSIYPDPAVKKVNFLEAIGIFMTKFGKNA